MVVFGESCSRSAGNWVPGDCPVMCVRFSNPNRIQIKQYEQTLAHICRHLTDQLNMATDNEDPSRSSCISMIPWIQLHNDLPTNPHDLLTASSRDYKAKPSMRRLNTSTNETICHIHDSLVRDDARMFSEMPIVSSTHTHTTFDLFASSSPAGSSVTGTFAIASRQRHHMVSPTSGVDSVFGTLGKMRAITMPKRIMKMC